MSFDQSYAYGSECAGFQIHVRATTQSNLLAERESMQFLEHLQKTFPTISLFKKLPNGDLTIGEDISQLNQRWVSLASKQVSCGTANPADVRSGMELPNEVLKTMPQFLSVSRLEYEAIDVAFRFDFKFAGNHHALLADTLLSGTPIGSLLQIEGATAVLCKPLLSVGLRDDLRIQARIEYTSAVTAAHIIANKYSAPTLSLYFVIRRWLSDRPRESLEAMADDLATRAEVLCDAHIVPNIVRPIASAIAMRS